MAVLTGGKAGTLVFAADLQSGGIYMARASGVDSLGTEDFRLFFHSPTHRRPVALAAGGGKVVIAYQEPPALVTVDLEGKASILWQGEPLGHPIAVAVLDNGIVAVADADTPGLFRLREEGDEDDRRWSIVPFGADVKVSDRLVAAGRELLVHDRASGAILCFDFEAPEPKGRLVVNGSNGKSRPEIAGMADFAFQRGIFYVSDAGRLQVFSRTEDEVFEPPFARHSHLSRLVATPEELFALDRDTGRIRRWPRPVPSVVKLEGDMAQATSNLAILVRSLVCREMLALREFEVQGQAITVEEALVLRGLFPGRLGDGKASLAPGPREGTTAPPAHGCTPETELPPAEALAEMICQIDPLLCTAGPRSPQQTLSRTLQLGEKVLLPDLEVRSYLTARHIDLSQRPVSEHLEERIPSPNLRKKVDAAYISSINAASFRTPESVLTRLGFIQATPPRVDLEPGTIIRFKKGLESVETYLASCSPAVRTAVLPEQKLKVPRITAKLSSNLVPGNVASERELAKWEVDTVELEFDEAAVERLDPARLESLFSSGEASSCTDWGRKAGNHLIIEALKLRGSRYRFLRRDGSVVFPSAEELTRARIAGRSGEESGWSLVVEGPLYFGYRLLPWEPSPGGPNWAQAPIGDPATKQDSPQNILTQSSGVLNVPAQAWRTSLLLPADALKNLDTYFPGIVRGKNELILLSTEDLLLEAHAVAMQATPAPQPGPTDSPALWQGLALNRQQLYQEINYDPELLDKYGLIVGVAENRSHVDFDHPDFSGADGTYAWVEITEDGRLQPILRPASTSVPAAQVRESAPQDHGTHVAGLIGARRGRLGVGLLPHAELLLLDTSNAARFHDSLRAAAARAEVSILNFSFSYSRRDAADELLRIMTSPAAANLLFVVAAGNDGEVLGNFERFPVCWADKIGNMLGVGASNWTKQLMDSWVDSRGDRQTGSNYGEKYVQMLAPGFEVYSTVAANGYAKQSGTSQAAPLVAGVAAVLAPDLSSPLRVKARLIYTADWYPHLLGKVWGGLLNVKRALWYNNLNLVWTQTEPTVAKSIFYKRTPELITLRGGQFYDQIGEIDNTSRSVPFRNVLRITLGERGLFRVIYLEEGSRRMRVLLDTAISGKLQCDRFQKWDKVKFVDTPECQAGFDVETLQDYVAKTPSSVRF